MKNEPNIENTDLNPFEAPANLWDRVEAGLDQQKPKRKAFVWWSIAAGIALLGGVGYAMISLLGSNDQFREELVAEVQLPANTEDSVKVDDPEEDTTTQEKEYSFEVVEPLPFDSTVIEFEVNNITTEVPFVNVAPSLTSAPPNNLTYTWVAPPFGNGGGTGSGSGNAAVTGNGTSATYYGFTSGTSYSVTTGSVNAATNGVIDGAQVSQHVPTKRVIPYTTLNEANNLQFGLGTFNQWGDGDGIPDQSSSSSYEAIQENTFKPTSDDPLSTFSIDVDGASYSDVRGMINRNNLPNPNAVRLEEFINYFPYEYTEPTDEHPFSINTEFAECPWNTEHQLLKIGIKGESIEKAQLPKNNLVFLLDVSGSMNRPEKLALLKKGFRLLVNELREEDRVAIAVYAGAAGLVLPPTSGANKDQILDALNRLEAGGSTAGGEGINLAYKTAQEYFDPMGNNRIILATDGDFNVGVSDNDSLVKLIEEKRKSGVFLTVLGFGHDNFQSDKMEKIANNGNGNFSFIDNILEAKKVLVTEMGATLKTIAKDVKIQVEFNPEHVGSYRLLGYENRMLEHQDFSNDTIDAGELGAGHTVTAVYEIIPPDVEEVDAGSNETELKYTKVEKRYGLFAPELATVKFRYKEPDGSTSKLIEQVVANTPEMKGSPDFEFIQSVIEFGLLMRQSQYAGNANFDAVLERATSAIGDDKFGYRKEFIMLVEKAKLLADPQLE